MESVEVGDKFRGTVNGVIFEVSGIRHDRAARIRHGCEHVWLSIDYEMSYGNGKIARASEDLLQHLIKSGGLVRI